jgi:RNA polymerase sigma factor (sigma-70 family)
MAEGIISLPARRIVDHEIDRTVRSTRNKLLGFIRSRVSDGQDAEDILQDVFYQFVEASDPEEPIEQVSSWLFTVARNKITDWYRKKRPDSFTKLESRSDGEDVTEFIDDVSLAPDEILENSFFREAMMKALDDLPEAQRDVFIMHEMEGIPFEEIARITREPVNTLLSRKRYAIRHLRKSLRDFAEEEQAL